MESCAGGSTASSRNCTVCTCSIIIAVRCKSFTLAGVLYTSTVAAFAFPALRKLMSTSDLASWPLGYSSAHAPLLTLLHERLTEIETAVARATSIGSKYGLEPGAYRLNPPTGELQLRRRRTAEAFDAVLTHVDDVSAAVDSDYVVLHRSRCGHANVLYRAAPNAEEVCDRTRRVLTKSPILSNSHSLERSFRPNPSREVVAYSPILAHSSTCKMLAVPL